MSMGAATFIQNHTSRHADCILTNALGLQGIIVEVLLMFCNERSVCLTGMQE
jgi:hypothetical protein